MKKYIAIVCLALCVSLAACGKPEKPVDVIYAPIDSTTQNNLTTQKDPGTEDTDTNVSDTADTTSRSDPDDTTGFDDTGSADTDIPEDTTGSVQDTETTENQEVINFDDYDYVIDISENLANGEPAKGQIASKQSERIRLLVNYICDVNSDTNQVIVDLEVVLEVYDINCGARSGMGKIIVDGEEHSYSTKALSLNNHVKSHVRFATFTYEIPIENTSCTIDVSWPFNGKYGEETIKDLRTTAIIVLTNEGFDA